MSLVVTKQLDPYYHSYSNRRTEFRLDTPNQIDSNIRLMKLKNGIFGATQYYKTVGVNGLIKQMRLYSGNILIDQTTDRFSLLSALLNQVGNVNSLNANQREIVNQLIFNNSMYSLLFENWNPNGNQANNFADVLVKWNADPFMTFDAQGEGYIKLRQFFPFLQSVGQGSGKSNFNLKDLRLVIEWNLTVDALNNDAGQFMNIPQPVLVYEEYQGEQPEMSPQVLFQGWEYDRVQIPAVANGQNQSEKFRIKGFNSKSVSNLVLAMPPILDTATERGTYCSPVQLNEEFQVYWNNIPVYQENVNAITKQLYLLDTMGDHLRLLGQDQFNKLNIDDIINYAVDQAPIQSWGAVDLQNLPVTNLQISYSRTGSNTYPWATQPFDLVVFGKVNKMVSIGETGEVNLSYPL